MQTTPVVSNRSVRAFRTLAENTGHKDVVEMHKRQEQVAATVSVVGLIFLVLQTVVVPMKICIMDESDYGLEVVGAGLALLVAEYTVDLFFVCFFLYRCSAYSIRPSGAFSKRARRGSSARVLPVNFSIRNSNSDLRDKLQTPESIFNRMYLFSLSFWVDIVATLPLELLVPALGLRKDLFAVLQLFRLIRWYHITSAFLDPVSAIRVSFLHQNAFQILTIHHLSHRLNATWTPWSCSLPLR